MRKPLSIIILSILFFVSPFGILIFNAAVNMVPLFGTGGIIYRLNPSDLLILILYPIAGISIFLVRKWGWWSLIISAVLMILYNLTVFFLNPFASLAMTLLMNTALFIAALLFFRKHLIAPYFNPRLRWWEQDQRYEIDLYLKFPGLDRNVIISDISAGGCYIFVDFHIDSGASLPVLIVCGSFRISLSAKVMRIARESDRYYGYGMMFEDVDEVQKAGLNELLNKLKTFTPDGVSSQEGNEKRSAPRYTLSHDLFILYGDEKIPANLMDISRSGCASTTSASIAVGDKCFLSFSINQVKHKLNSQVIWKRSHGENSFYGLKFSKPDKFDSKAIKGLIQHVQKMGGHKREFDKDDYYRMCDESAQQTPYRIFNKFQRLLTKR